jgi:predicted phage tail protein
MSIHVFNRDIEGAGGGKKGGGGSEADNTLQSNARARIAELISEGPCEGIVGGLKGFYLDGTPVENADGTKNFEGVRLVQRLGTPDQQHIPGLPMVETPFSVEAQVKLETGPVTRRVLEANADAVRVVIRIPALLRYDSKGRLKPYDAHYKIEVRSLEGAWKTAVDNHIKNQKTNSPWQISHRVELPAGEGPWDIRVTNLMETPEDTKKQNQVFWESYTVVTEGKFTYPNSAYAFFEINARQFGSNIPGRAYKFRGLRIRVPSNYDPVARVYTGIWNGTFKTAWTNNPAWIFYDLITNDRYGLGEFIDPARVDKWTLYNIGRYCDEMIPSGYKRADNSAIYEPRFTFNGVINTKSEAFEVLKNVTNAFRGMAFWALGQTYAVADIPADPVKLVTPANVIGGSFSYSGTAKKARHSVAIVTWNDQDDLGRPATELVINAEALAKYGWRETSIVKHGCTSRGEAHRFGKWILDTEHHETETITYTAGWDHAELRPFDLISVADPAKAQVRAGGRVRRHSGNQIELDAPFDTSVGGSLSISLTMPDGTVVKRAITAVSGDKKTVTAAGFPSAAAVNSVYIITSTEVNPRQYRVLTVKETEDSHFEVTALFHDPNKYSRVEYGIDLDDIPYTRPGSTVPAPTNLKATENQYVENSIPQSKILFSFTPGSDLAATHSVTVDGPDGIEEFTGLTKPSIEVRDVEPGLYVFTVRSYSAKGIPSQPAVLQFEASGWAGGEVLSVVELRTVEGGAIFNSRNCILQWRNVIPEGADLYKDNRVTVYDLETNEVLREEFIVATEYNYSFVKNKTDAAKNDRDPYRTFRVEVRVRDKTGRVSPPASLVVSNPVPATPQPQWEPGYGQIFLFWQNPKDTDFSGTLVWVMNDPDLVPVLTEAEAFPGQSVAPLYDTMASEVVVPAFTEKYVRIGCYDTFGKTGIFISAPLKVTPLNFVVDTDPPEKPTGLALTSKLDIDGKAIVDVTWDSNAEEDLAQYDLEIAFWDGNFMSIPTGSNFYTFTCAPGTLIRARLRARDVSSNGSYYTDMVEHIAAADTVPPETPINITVRASFKSIWLKWDNNIEPDLMRYEVYVSETTTPPLLTELNVYHVTSNIFNFTDLEAGVTRHFWVRARDTSMNVSPWSEMIIGKTVALDPVDLDLDRLALPKHVEELPYPITEESPQKVYLVPTKEFYVQYEDEWILETDARNITGSILGSQIGDDEISETNISNLSISTPLLRSNAVDARKLRADTIEARHIKADAIGAGHIAADAVTAKQLSAESVLADKIKAGEIRATHLAADNVITLSAQIAEAIIDDAHITELNAAKLKAGTILSGEVLIGAEYSLAQLATDASDPAARVNAGSTLIKPGKIMLTGTTPLTHWITGGDSTEIDGGKISAGSIKANSVVVGMRNVTASGIEFDHSGNTLTWTAGEVSYTADNGSKLSTSVSSGSASFSSSTVYIYWTQGQSRLNSTTSIATAFADNNVVIATYNGGANINADYGRTIIDGDKIKTGTIDAQQIAANAIRATNIQAGAITATHISSGSIDTQHIAAGAIEAGKIAAGAITASKIAVGTITADRLVLGGITYDRIQEGAVSDIATDSSTGSSTSSIQASIAIEVWSNILAIGYVSGINRTSDPTAGLATLRVNGTTRGSIDGPSGTAFKSMRLGPGTHTVTLNAVGLQSGTRMEVAILAFKR